MALENFKHISLIFYYLLENHVWKSDDFSLNLVEFWLWKSQNAFDFSTFQIYDSAFWLYFFGKRKVGVWM
jgi:hypothetical protein